MRYPLTNSYELLSSKAKALGELELEAQLARAERLLGLGEGSVVTDATSVSHLRMALALQVNFQLEQPAEAFVVQSTGRGGRSTTYREGQRLIHPEALHLVAGVLGSSEYVGSRGYRNLAE